MIVGNLALLDRFKLGPAARHAQEVKVLPPWRSDLRKRGQLNRRAISI